MVAALFAVHPLHVESVAWIAERKDLLSTLFFLLTLLAYQSYVRTPNVRRYLLVLLLFTLGLMSKPMLVTLPLLLLVLDYWPLERGQPACAGTLESRRPWARTRVALRLVVEKLPLMALAAAASVLTWLVQPEGGPEYARGRHQSFRALGQRDHGLCGLSRQDRVAEPLGGVLSLRNESAAI